jgi:hypothetical protein
LIIYFIFLYNIMSSTPTAVPASAYGMQPQTVAPPPPGSNGSIYSNGAAISKNNAELQNTTNKIGGSKRSFRGGAAEVITVSPMTVPYREAGTGDNTTAANLTNSTKAQSEIYANKQYDLCVGSKDATCGQSGGRKKRVMRKSLTNQQSLRGGWPAWGCMSGGKRKTCRKRKGKTCRKRRGKTCRKRRGK